MVKEIQGFWYRVRSYQSHHERIPGTYGRL